RLGEMSDAHPAGVSQGSGRRPRLTARRPCRRRRHEGGGAAEAVQEMASRNVEHGHVTHPLFVQLPTDVVRLRLMLSGSILQGAILCTSSCRSSNGRTGPQGDTATSVGRPQTAAPGERIAKFRAKEVAERAKVKTVRAEEAPGPRAPPRL